MIQRKRTDTQNPKTDTDEADLFAESFNRDLLPHAADFAHAVALRVALIERIRGGWTSARAMTEARHRLELTDNSPVDLQDPRDLAYHNFRMELRAESERAKLTPAQVALYLEARRAEFPQISDSEIEAYMKSPDSWANVKLA